jgi:hypothetical protein
MSLQSLRRFGILRHYYDHVLLTLINVNYENENGHPIGCPFLLVRETGLARLRAERCHGKTCHRQLF